jgi:twitching motility two-component system response regulator PilH
VQDQQSPPLLDVLVATGDPSVRDELEFGASADIGIHFARDAREAWARLQERAPSAVVVDLQAGSAGGFALTRDMSYDERFADIPVVMLLERDQDGWLSRQAGASLYRIKPVVAGELMRDIEELVTQRVR